MSDFLKKLGGYPSTSTGANVPATTSGTALLTSLRPARTAVVASTGAASGASALTKMTQTAERMAVHRKRPLLIYLILDLTASRESTREPMRPHEQKIAEMITQCGGEHPVICKGVYFRGDACSSPQPLNTVADIKRFFDLSPEMGRTKIEQALSHYLNDSCDNEILSLGLFVGDTADSDSLESLEKLARSLAEKKRPLLIAHENTGDVCSAVFCEQLAPNVAILSGGVAGSLSGDRNWIVNFLDGVRKILAASPDDLAQAGGSSPQRPGLEFIGSASTVAFLKGQAKRVAEQTRTLLLTGPQPPQ